MEESSQNENTMNNNDEIYLNDVVMEEEITEEDSRISPRMQTKENINTNEGKEKMKKNSKKKVETR